MEIKILFLFSFLVSFWDVRSMSIQGPVLTRYDPCGLGVIYFDRLRDNYWKGVVHFGLYQNLVEVEMLMKFKEEVTLYPHHSSYNYTERRTNQHDLLFHSTQPIPDIYIFYVSLNHLIQNEEDVPHLDILTLNNVTLCNDDIKASQTIRSLNVTYKYSGKPYVHVCGRRSIEHAEVMSLRTDADAGDWPWHVAITSKNKNNVFKYCCGGNIISRTAILTAGHCVVRNGIKAAAHNVMVIAGTNNYKDVNQPGRQAMIAQHIIVHPSYNDEFATSDLAIIKVNGLEFTEYVQPICLWGPIYDKSSLYGKEATVVGFGTTELNQPSDVLRSTNIMVQNDTTCVLFSPNLYGKLLNEFTFCAGYGPTSSINSRNGDSGGGLVISTIQPDHQISWFLRGVLSKCGVSPGQKNCDPTYYVVYVDVAPHYGWIYHNAGLEYRNNIVFT